MRTLWQAESRNFRMLLWTQRRDGGGWSRRLPDGLPEFLIIIFQLQLEQYWRGTKGCRQGYDSA